MKIASIINPHESKQVNVILQNTSYSNHIELVHDSHFKLTSEFFEFVEDLIGKGKIGNIEDCLVSIVDYKKIDEYIDPMNKLLQVLSKVSKENG